MRRLAAALKAPARVDEVAEAVHIIRSINGSGALQKWKLTVTLSREAALTHPDRIDALIEADALELCGNVEAAARLRKRSIAGASEADLNCYAYTLLWRNLIDRAITLLQDNAAAHPDSWNAYDSLAEAHVQNGDLARALVNYTLAARLAPDGEQYARIMRRVEELQAKFAQVAGR